MADTTRLATCILCGFDYSPVEHIGTHDGACPQCAFNEGQWCYACDRLVVDFWNHGCDQNREGDGS
jgi:hypothetical protein